MSVSLVPKAFVIGLIAWVAWRLFGPVAISDTALITSAALCFGVPLVVVLVLPYLYFELGQRIMRLYRLRKDWLIMRDLPVASKRAWRRVRAEARRRKA
jgi:hypothetical protein